MSGSRTTTGCYTCRLRKKKCDEQKPFCLTCCSREIMCYGYGSKPEWMHGKSSWKEVMESKEAKLIQESAELTYRSRHRQRYTRNRYQIGAHQPSGSQGEKSNANLVVKPQQQQLNKASYEILEPKRAVLIPATQEENRFCGDAHAKHNRSYRSPDPTSISRLSWDINLSSVHGPSRTDFGLLMNFLDIIFPLQYGFYGLSGDTDRKWLFDAIIEAEPLYQASMSLTIFFQDRMRYSNTPGDFELSRNARRLQLGAIQGLHIRVHELATAKLDSIQLLQKGMQTLAIMTQIFSLEIFKSLEGQWEIHVEAARIILGMFQAKWAPELFEECENLNYEWELTNKCSTNHLKTLKFFVTSFVWVDIIANTIFGQPPYNSKHFKYVHLIRNNFLKLQEVMGCQSWIMLSIAEITQLESWKRFHIERGTLSITQLVKRGTALNDRLLLGIKGIEDRPCKDINSLEADSEAVSLNFAYGALVFLHTVVSGAWPLTPEIKNNVTRCLERLEAMPMHLLVRNSLPFTIAGCMATEDQYDRFHGIVESTAMAKQALGTSWKGLRVMEECWRLRKEEPGLWCWRSTMTRMNTKILLI